MDANELRRPWNCETPETQHNYSDVAKIIQGETSIETYGSIIFAGDLNKMNIFIKEKLNKQFYCYLFTTFIILKCMKTVDSCLSGHLNKRPVYLNTAL